jgi:DNA-binding transcriptional LysR family regulator
MFGILRDTGIVPNVTQTVGEVPTLISLVHSRMGITITPLSVVKHSFASVVACNIVDRIPMSEIGMAFRKGTRAPVVDNFQIFRPKNLRSSKKLFAR